MPDGALTGEYQAFFARYKSLLTQDFESELIWRQISRFRWLNSALAARSLYEILEERLLGPVTFEHLSQRETRGDSPYLIVNTTLYNNGRRLTFTTLPGEASQYDFFEALQASLAKQGKPTEIPPQLVERWKTLPPSPAGSPRQSVPVPLAGLSPGRRPLRRRADYLPGGRRENYGTRRRFTRTRDRCLLCSSRLQERQARRALIVAFDSSYPFSVGARQLSRRSDPFTLFTYDFSRIPSIMEERATAYQALFFRSLQLEGVFPDHQTLRVVLLRHIDAKWQDDLSDLPAACRSEKSLRTPEDVVERIAEIPTRFWLPSECDRQLLVTAAAKVAQNRHDILELLEAPAPPRAAR
jgi:hypothetical protein